VRAINDRVIGWQLMRSMMRWTPMLPDEESLKGFDAAAAMRMMLVDGVTKFEEFMQHHAKMRVEALPALQIYSNCERLIRAIPLAKKGKKNQEDVDKAHFLGMDSLDACRYLIMLYNSEVEVAPPPELRVEMEMEKVLARNPGMSMHSMVLARKIVEQEVDEEEQAKLEVMDFRGRRRRAFRGTIRKILEDGGVYGNLG
jgi:hypothetical protein